MWNRIKVAIASTSIFLLLGGCNAFEKNYASLDHVCSSDGKQNFYSLAISKPTNELVMGHSGLNYVVLHYNFTLAVIPKERTVYSVSMLTLDRDYLPKSFPELVSGSILIDQNKRKVIVSLLTRDGAFSGNGEYPLKYLP